MTNTYAILELSWFDLIHTFSLKSCSKSISELHLIIWGTIQWKCCSFTYNCLWKSPTDTTQFYEAIKAISQDQYSLADLAIENLNRLNLTHGAYRKEEVISHCTFQAINSKLKIYCLKDLTVIYFIVVNVSLMSLLPINLSNTQLYQLVTLSAFDKWS